MKRYLQVECHAIYFQVDQGKKACIDRKSLKANVVKKITTEYG